MKRIVTALIILTLSLLYGVTAYAQTSVTITPAAPDADSGAATIVAWGAEEAYHLSGDVVTENGIPIVKKTFELAPGAEPQTLVQAFEQDGYRFSCREILRRELPGEMLTKQAFKTALTESESDDKAEIMRHFPDTIAHEQDGYSGQLTLDPTSFRTEAASYERYSYSYTKTREISGLDRNDPAYIEREWNGMTLVDVRFKLDADGRYTAAAVYQGTASGKRPSGYITTAVYRGELAKTTPGNVQYTVVYEGMPIAQPTPAPMTDAPETEPADEPITPETEPPITPEESNQPAPFPITAVCAFLIGVVAATICMAIIYIKERKKTHEEIEALKALITESQ
jgi:hypothetical protein